MTVSEKQQQLATLDHRITLLKSTLKVLYNNISRVKGEIFAYANANTLFTHARPATIPEHTTSMDVDTVINDEHLQILTEKQNELGPLRAEIAELRQSEELLENKLDILRDQCFSLEFEIVDTTDSIHAARSETQSLQTELIYLNSQIKERSSEIRSMLDTRRQAETVAAEIVSKSEAVEVDDGGRLDCTKAVNTLQHDLHVAEAELANLQNKIAASSFDAKYETTTLTETQNEHDRAVKWKTERIELKEELERLTEELRVRKGTMQTTESRAFTDRNVLAKVAPLVKKWKGAAGGGEVVVPERATVVGLLAELERVKKVHDDALKAEQEKVAALIVSNAALEKEVLRSKAALDCAVERFHSGEARLREEIDQIKAKSGVEEQKLLAQIAKAKLHIGQARLQKS
jgi:chromosome segregation ATPase